MANRYIFGGYMDLGEGKESQEDFINCIELDDKSILCIVADGTGSIKGYPQPAGIAATEIAECVSDVFKSHSELFLQAPEYFLMCAIKSANKVLGGFKIGNEELFSGYSASISCLFITRSNQKNRFFLAHCGNTRIYLLRSGRLMALTEDHTIGASMLAEGKIDQELYYSLPERLKLTSGVGLLWNPMIQTRSGIFKSSDLFIMTTDGIHYALRPEGISTIVLNSSDCSSAAQNLINGAKEFKYPDNMSAIVIQDSMA